MPQRKLAAAAAVMTAIALIVPRSGLTPFWGRVLDLTESALLLSLIPLCLAVLGVCILVGRTTTALLRPLAAAGSMTLTLYSLHLLLLSWSVMPGGGTGLLIQTVLVVAFALVWSRFHARGPLEEIVARATGAVRRRVQSGTERRRRTGAHRA